MAETNPYPLLSGLKHPQELRGYSTEKLQALADEARAFLIESIQQTGGHLGAALGVTELTVALCHVFDFAQDRIAWDVGHQAHVYKLLTGRKDDFSRYGKWGGMSKFLERRESSYDHMGAGHASTSISAALGMAIARDLREERHHALAVIGDGAMTGGLAYEALSVAGDLRKDLLVILNDNGMSIDSNVGGLSRVVTRFTTSHAYQSFRGELKNLSQYIPLGGEFLKSFRHVERSLKDYASPGVAALVETLGFSYFGPVDGHNLRKLLRTLKDLKTIKGPVFLHVKTVKGKGMGEEVENTFAAHAFTPVKAPPAETSGTSGASASAGSASSTGKREQSSRSWTSIFSGELDGIMARDSRVVAITAAMLTNTGLAPLREKYPGRVFDVGIAEAHGYCSAAGMAIGGLKPFVTIYSTFSQRAFDQLIHDIALQSLPVRIMLDRGGFVGADGPTHHGVFDFSYLRLIPNFVHMAPSSVQELRAMMRTAHQYEAGPIAMRYPRGNTEVSGEEHVEAIPLGKGEVVHSAMRPRGYLLVLALGSMVPPALDLAEHLEARGIPVEVVNLRFVKPLDEALIAEKARAALAVLSLEENVIAGGVGEGIARILGEENLQLPLKICGIPDAFVGYGSLEDQLRFARLDFKSLHEAATLLWRKTGQKPAGTPVLRLARDHIQEG